MFRFISILIFIENQFFLGSIKLAFYQKHKLNIIAIKLNIYSYMNEL